MSITVKRVASSHVQHGDHRSRPAYTDDYEGTVDGKPFGVQINPEAAPLWRGDINESEMSDILIEIELLLQIADGTDV